MTYISTDDETYSVLITHLSVVEPNSAADNPDDYYGYTELEFDVLDDRGKIITSTIDDDELEALHYAILAAEADGDL